MIGFITKLTKSYLPVIILGLLGLSPVPLLGDTEEYFSAVDDQNHYSDTYFQYGAPCTKLAELSYQEFIALTHPSHRELFGDFCMPEDVYSCSDYNGLLYQTGQLEDTSGPMCRFKPGS